MQPPSGGAGSLVIQLAPIGFFGAMDTSLPRVDFLQTPVEVVDRVSESLPDFDVFRFNDLFKLLVAYRPERFGCVVLYNWSDGSESLGLIGELCNRVVPARVILVVKHGTMSIGFQASRCGAAAVLDASTTTDELMQVITEQIDLDRRDRPTYLHDQEFLNRAKLLSESERIVFRQMLVGSSNRAAASKLAVSQRTVESRRRKVFEVMGTRSIPELARIAARLAPHAEFLRIDEGRDDVLSVPHFS